MKKSSMARTADDKLFEVDGLAHVRVRMQVVGRDHVLFRIRGREDDDGDPSQVRVTLDVGQHLATIPPRQVEVEEHEVRGRRVGESALLA